MHDSLGEETTRSFRQLFARLGSSRPTLKLKLMLPGRPALRARGERRLRDTFGSRLLIALPVACAAAAVVGLSAAPAAEAACSTEYGVFWKMSTGTYGLAYGARNEIEVKQHSIDSSCASGSYPVAETSHLRLGGNDGDWVEAGYEEDGSATPRYVAFAEWGLNYTTKSFNTRSYACLSAPSYERWEPVNAAGTYNWNTWLDCEDGAGWRLLFQYSSTGFARGIPMGEGSRYGDNSGITAVHQNLQWQDATNTWNYASGVSCYSDNDPTYSGSGVTASRFDIVTASGSC